MRTIVLTVLLFILGWNRATAQIEITSDQTTVNNEYLIGMPSESKSIYFEENKILYKRNSDIVNFPDESMIITETPDYLKKSTNVFVRMPESSMVITDVPDELRKVTIIRSQ